MFRRSFAAIGLVAALALTFATAVPAKAEGYRAVENLDTFVDLISGRELRRLGIALTVTPQGQIAGQAFGYPVTGAWTWEAGYFCRALFWDGDDLGYNCQMVEFNGNRLRFTSDRGTGQSASLALR